MAKSLRIYWDSCAWIGLLNGELDKKRELEIVYGNARDGKCKLWTSTISLIECRHVGNEKKQARPYDAINDAKISEMFNQPFVKCISLTMDIAEDARRIWRGTREISKYPDAVHIASALRWNITMMHTYDRSDLFGLSETFSCRNGKKLEICYPDNTTDGPLFGKARKVG